MYITYKQHVNINMSIILKQTHLSTILGDMIAISDEDKLYLLCFANQKNKLSLINKITRHYKASFLNQSTYLTQYLQRELNAYFKGDLKDFTLPFILTGTDFQKKAWKFLLTIPYGQTATYLDQAHQIDAPTSFRAVASANAGNALTLILPCHRVIRKDRFTGNYSAGEKRKKWLILFEEKNNTSI